jgi:hypothetical protein
MQEINPVPGLVPYIACAAVAAFAMNYCIQSVQAGLNASDRFGGRSEAVQSMNIADRSHKGDRLPGTHRIYGQATAGSVDVGPVDPAPATVSRPTPPQSLGACLGNGPSDWFDTVPEFGGHREHDFTRWLSRV